MRAIASLVLDKGASLETFDFVQKHSIPVQDSGNLVMRCDLADITVETHDKPQVDIEAVISIAATNRNQAAALLGKHGFRKDLRIGDDARGVRLVEGRDALWESGWHSVECAPGQFSAEAIEPFLTMNHQSTEQPFNKSKKKRLSSSRRVSIDTQVMQQLSIRRILESNDQCNISLRVKVPKQFNLNVFAGAGEVSLPDIIGDLNVVVNNANVTLGDTVGNLDIFVENGFLLAGDVTGNAVVNGKVGDIKLGDVSGRVEISTKNAHVEINKVNQRAYARLDYGRIQIGEANGGARLTIAEVGNIHVADITGEIQASTSEGAITVQRIGQINTYSSIFTKDGAIRIAVNSDTSIDIEASSEMGRVQGSLFPEGKTNVADIQLNGGGPTLLLRSQRSSIQLDKVDKSDTDTLPVKELE